MQASVLVDKRLRPLPLQLLNVLPAVGALGQSFVGVLYPDHRGAGIASLLLQRVDVGEHAIAVMGAGDHVAPYVDDQEGGVGAISARSSRAEIVNTRLSR